MKFARHKREEVSVNLTPLIDIVFLLLIFFMVSTTFTKESRLILDLPEANGEPASAASEFVEITVSAVGEYAINGEVLSAHNLNTLLKGIGQIEAKTGTDIVGGTKLPMMITADAKAPHQAVVTAMDAAGQAGYVNLSITTIEPGSN